MAQEKVEDDMADRITRLKILHLKNATRNAAMPIITIEEKITKTIDIPLDSLYQVIDNLPENDRHALIERLKSKPVRLKKFQRDNIEKIISDFKETNLYEDNFLKDLETGLMKSSANRKV